MTSSTADRTTPALGQWASGDRTPLNANERF